MAPQREWFEKDYYAALGISSDASDKDVQKAYRKLAKQYHPDANAGDANAEERFKDVSAAGSVAAGVVAARGRSVRCAAKTSRPSCTSTSSTQSMASRRRST